MQGRKPMRRKSLKANGFCKVLGRFWERGPVRASAGTPGAETFLEVFGKTLDRMRTVRSSTAACHLNDGGRIDDALRGEGTSRHRSRHRDRHREFGRLGPELNNGLSILFWGVAPPATAVAVILGSLEAVLGQSWGHLAPSWGHVGCVGESKWKGRWSK